MFIPNQTQGTKGECSACIHHEVCGKTHEFDELKKKVFELNLPEHVDMFHVTVRCDNYVDTLTPVYRGGCS